MLRTQLEELVMTDPTRVWSQRSVGPREVTSMTLSMPKPARAMRRAEEGI